MATALMQQVILLPRASHSNCFANRHVDVSKSWNGALSSWKRGRCNGRKQESRGNRKTRSYVTKCSSSEKAAYAVKEVTDEELEKQVQPSDIRVLAAIRSSYNYITVMEVSQEADHLLAGARLLLLDNPGCIHTVYYEQNVLTNSYYDALATVVPLLPPGPVGILGLGAGATSHVLRHFFPRLETHGWELDPQIIAIARQFFNLALLEGVGGVGGDAGNVSSSVDEEAPGVLTVHVGDAVGPSVTVEGGFAGLIVDLFAEGRVIPALQEPRTWVQLQTKLKPGGRIMVNCGGDRVRAGEQSSSKGESAGQLYMEQTMAALKQVFGADLSTRYLARKGFNSLALTGPSPDLHIWSLALPEPLRDGIADWKPVS